MTVNNSEILFSVREGLISEARQSPGLFADLANLEKYIAETYSARSFIELLQNADDAHAERFVLARVGQWLVCANDGYSFTRQDFLNLCRSASSSKQRGQTIGYRGIGFKSVVGLATEVHLFSGDLQTTFSRELTLSSLGTDMPTPLVRVPHPLALSSEDPVSSKVDSLRQSGLKTIFVLGGLNGDRVQEEFDQFDSDYLLFLRHVREVSLTSTQNHRYTCERQDSGPNIREVTIAGSGRHSAWRIHRAGECDMAFSLFNGEPVALTSAAAIVHAFLPTLETTGLGIRINADFSTDPSRTRIVLDDATLSHMDKAAAAVAELISESTQSGECGGKVWKALTPTIELATLNLQKRSFRTEFIARVKSNLITLKEQLVLAPAWLNTPDVSKLAAHLNLHVLSISGGADAAHTTFFRYIGIPVISPKIVVESARHIALSMLGCAELLTHSARNVTSGIKMRELIDAPIWWAEYQHKPTGLKEVFKGKAALSTAFLSVISAVGLPLRELARLLSSGGLSPEIISILLPDGTTLIVADSHAMKEEAQTLEQGVAASESLDMFLSDERGAVTPSYASTAPITSQSLPAWRGAEQYVVQLLQQHGYSVEDRSRQNLGYDVYAEKRDSKHYLEVKLLDYAGQPFVITTNEEAVAREYGSGYIIALTLRSAAGVHIQFIRDPARNLKFVRQCRQWVWECSDYTFSPTFSAK